MAWVSGGGGGFGLWDANYAVAFEGDLPSVVAGPLSCLGVERIPRGMRLPDQDRVDLHQQIDERGGRGHTSEAHHSARDIRMEDEGRQDRDGAGIKAAAVVRAESDSEVASLGDHRQGPRWFAHDGAVQVDEEAVLGHGLDLAEAGVGRHEALGLAVLLGDEGSVNGVRHELVGIWVDLGRGSVESSGCRRH